jgi:predicted RNA-binding Zn ribbon-like protein
MRTAPDLVDLSHAHDVSLDDTFDFLNTDDTEEGVPDEQLPSLDAVLTWFVDRRVIHHEGADHVRHQARARPEVMTRELARVHAVRSAMREVVQAVVEHRAPRRGSLDTINRALHARQVIELVPATEGVSVNHRHVGDPVDDALARLAAPLVAELTGGHPERIKFCASDTCSWIFYDESRTSRRRWCDMATCGNRAKAARHRARTKGVGAVDATTESTPAN